MLKNFDILTRDFEMLETVYNTEKKITQFVLTKIPHNRKAEFGVPKTKKAYICSELGSTNWTVEFQENLRAATIFERR